jgi:hypothetical protein
VEWEDPIMTMSIVVLSYIFLGGMLVALLLHVPGAS